MMYNEVIYTDFRSFVDTSGGGGGGGAGRGGCKLYAAQRLWFLSRFSLKSGMLFKGTTKSVLTL